MLKIENLYKSFEDFPVLYGLNWEIKEKEIMGLVGVNGSGKSTLLRCISEVYDRSKGQILFDGVRIEDKKDKLTFISDEPFYFSRFSTKEMKNFYKSFYKSFDEKEYSRLLQVFDLDENKPIHQFSKGLKRQSALVLGLACQTELLMMDESFDGLDPKARLTLKREMVRSVQDKNMSIIISTHNIREIEDIADRIALLKNGQISLSKSLDDLDLEYHKVQVGYSEAPDPEIFKSWDALSLEISGKIVTVIYKGESLMEEIEKTHPILINPLDINMEEILVTEMEDKYE